VNPTLGDGRIAAYVRAAVERELEALPRTAPGSRARATFRAAAALGGLVGAGVLGGEAIEGLLVVAATATGLDEAEALRHVRSGLRKGASTPRKLPTAYAIRPAASGHGRPPAAEVESIWRGSVTVTSDRAAESWLRSRGLDPVAIEQWDLARAIPVDAELPRWARTRLGGPWSRSGHRLLLRIWDARGRHISLRARSIVTRPDLPKELAPAGFAAKGLVLADPLSVQLLRGRAPAWWERRDVVVSEGCPDFLVWAGRQRDGREGGPAVLGVVSGSWTLEIASRIPSGARVVVRTHHDVAGQEYAETIEASLRGRCRLFRSAQGAAS